MSFRLITQKGWRYAILLPIMFGGLFGLSMVSSSQAGVQTGELGGALTPHNKPGQAQTQSKGQQPAAQNYSSLGNFAQSRAATNPARILYDQYDNPSWSGVTSQNFEARFDAFDSQGADDFIVPAGEVWVVDQVDVAGGYAGGPADSVNVIFYASAGYLPGSPVFTQTNVVPSSGLDTGDFAITLSPPATLPPGSYWVSVQANQVYETSGQWFWRNRWYASFNPAAWRNPGGAFNHGCTGWGRRAYECFLADEADDQVFRLSGASLGTPTPTLTGTPPTGTSTATTTATNTSTATVAGSTTTPSPAPPTRTGTRYVPPPMATWPMPVTSATIVPIPTSTPAPACGLHWRVVPSANVGFFGNYLNDVEVIAPDDIWAVGSFSEGESSRTLAMHWDGTQWLEAPTPNLGTSHNFLREVSATSSGDVWAVGSSFNTYRYETLVLRWGGSQWSVVPSPNPGERDSFLNGVVAVTPQDVWAVGGYRDNMFRQYPMALRWTGTGWTVTPIPSSGVPGSSLSDVAAVAADDVWAVGSYYDDNFEQRTLTLRWDGSQWSIVPSPNVGQNSNVLFAVHGISSQDVWAVGSYLLQGYSPRTLAMRWNGSQWSIVPTIEPGANYALLNDVQVISEQEVWAVGYYGDDDRTQTLIQRWNGSQWSIAPSANPGPRENRLMGLGATTSQDLWAVGYYRSGNGAWVTLVERYNDPCVTPVSTSTPTRTPTNSPTRTLTNTSTSTPTNTPTNTPTYTPPYTPTNTPTNTPIPSRTSTFTPTPCPIHFEDVRQDNPFYTHVRCLACRGIVSGYEDGTFKPGNLVTRGQLAKIVSNAAGFQENPHPQIFEDVPSNNPFYEWINRLARRGHMGGYECGGPGEPCVSGMPYFRPFANATRGQTSKIVSNAAEYNDPVSGQTFEDVPGPATGTPHPFYEWIERLASRGVMGGYECGSPGEPCMPGNRAYFRPHNNVTRGQSAKIVANTFYPNCQTP